MKNFKIYLLKLKKSIKTISGIRNMWCGSKNSFAREIRILSEIFLRKYALNYIFNSRIKDYALNIKYRKKMLEAIEKPEEFTSLKDF